jgi:hypothetical protein
VSVLAYAVRTTEGVLFECSHSPDYLSAAFAAPMSGKTGQASEAVEARPAAPRGAARAPSVPDNRA